MRLIEYQKAHVELPLLTIAIVDDGDSYDTVRLENWECVKADEWAKFLITKINVSDNWYVKYQIEDTGFQVVYYFVRKDGEWYLNLIIDDSM